MWARSEDWQVLPSASLWAIKVKKLAVMCRLKEDLQKNVHILLMMTQRQGGPDDERKVSKLKILK